MSRLSEVIKQSNKLVGWLGGWVGITRRWNTVRTVVNDPCRHLTRLTWRQGPRVGRTTMGADGVTGTERLRLVAAPRLSDVAPETRGGREGGVHVEAIEPEDGQT